MRVIVFNINVTLKRRKNSDVSSLLVYKDINVNSLSNFAIVLFGNEE